MSTAIGRTADGATISFLDDDTEVSCDHRTLLFLRCRQRAAYLMTTLEGMQTLFCVDHAERLLARMTLPLPYWRTSSRRDVHDGNAYPDAPYPLIVPIPVPLDPFDAIPSAPSLFTGGTSGGAGADAAWGKPDGMPADYPWQAPVVSPVDPIESQFDTNAYGSGSSGPNLPAEAPDTNSSWSAPAESSNSGSSYSDSSSSYSSSDSSSSDSGCSGDSGGGSDGGGGGE